MKRVFVGLSGGVDSAVSAALLKSKGYDVVGAFIKIWQPEFIECTWREDRLDAMRVAVALGIPFKEIDLSESYKKRVVEDMLKNYALGVTPNPDVLCNRYIKFGDFLDWAESEGADFIATGHYARVNFEEGKHVLLRGVDHNKDQSYFLYTLTESILAKTLFPIGGMKKGEVRAFAKRFHLPNAERPDSQGLCFIGEVSMKDFLARFISTKPGLVLDMKGKIIGEHGGAALYTVGQRHGFSTKAGIEGKQYYIVATDVVANTLYVSMSREDAAHSEVAIADMHWIGDAPPIPFACETETRYRETPVSAEIFEVDGKTRVKFEKKHIAAPGQSLVIYKGDSCLGGGIILN